MPGAGWRWLGVLEVTRLLPDPPRVTPGIPQKVNSRVGSLRPSLSSSSSSFLPPLPAKMMQRQLKSLGQQRSSSRPTAAVASSRRLSVRVHADAALIVNCKSGGHAFVGYYLAKALMAKGHSVTIMNDGDQVRWRGRS